MSKAYKQGYQAGLAKDYWCPHVCGTKEWEKWWDGQWAGVEQRMREKSRESESVLELDKKNLEHQKQKQSR